MERCTIKGTCSSGRVGATYLTASFLRQWPSSSNIAKRIASGIEAQAFRFTCKTGAAITAATPMCRQRARDIAHKRKATCNSGKIPPKLKGMYIRQKQTLSLQVSRITSGYMRG